MLTFKSFIKLYEELTPEQKASVAKWERDPKAIAHTDHFFGKGNDDKHEPLHGGVDKSEPHRAVERHLGHEISHEDYKAGLTKDKYGRRVKIGGILQKTKAHSELINSFANDSTRQLKKQGGLSVHVTRSVAGVAGQTSSGQSWEHQSCKNFDTGSGREHLKHEVHHGTVVAYLKDHHGYELARQTFQPYHSIHGKVVYRRNSYYGPKHAEFEKHGEELEKKLSSSHEPTLDKYTINPHVYNDSGITHTLHPNIDSEHIAKALDDKNSFVRRDALQHPKADSTHITQALKDPDMHVRLTAIKHSKATAEHITQALNDKEASVRDTAIRHSNATAEHITQALNDTNSYVRNSAIKHPNATADHITHAFKDKDADVRAAAIRHSNATEDHIKMGMSDKSLSVRLIAKSIGQNRFGITQ